MVTIQYGASQDDPYSILPSEDFASERTAYRQKLLSGAFVAAVFGAIALQFIN